ncbi:MAG: ACT domain-containing protein [Clostridiales Family XIII bacterium]|jgi:hypothetical protein|nr:ACT domain-containing protein [Clostridiales Family XIII bacterium]
MRLELLDNTYSVYKLKADHPVPASVFEGDFASVTKTKDELSIVAPADAAPRCAEVEDGWKILKISGVLDFGLIGVLSGLSAILTAEGISIFAISTYNTDYILIKAEAAESAISALEKNGHEVVVSSEKAYNKS